jgi:para-nitrobenzyl esterase
MHLFTAFDPTIATLTEDDLREQFDRRFGHQSSEALATYRTHRVGATNAQLLSALQTDETFRVTARRLAQAKTSGPVWSYWFCHPSAAFDGLLGSCHGLDIPYAFSNLDRPGVPMFIGEHPQHLGVAAELSGRLIRFASSGDPGWDHYDPQDRTTLQIGGIPTGVNIEDVDGPVSQTLRDPEPEIRELWDNIA